MNSYRELKVWQRAMDVAETVYRITREFPKQEQYGLVSQIQRSAVAVPANILPKVMPVRAQETI